MDEFIPGLALGVVMASVVWALATSSAPAAELRWQSCVRTCGRAEYLTSQPAMCVCKDDSTHAGKPPEFYR